MLRHPRPLLALTAALLSLLPPAGTQLRISQRYQGVQALWQRGDRPWALHGRLDDRDLRLLGAGATPRQARVEDERLVVSTPGIRCSDADPSPRRALRLSDP